MAKSKKSPKDNYYKQYIIIPTSKSKRAKFDLFGIDKHDDKGIKIGRFNSNEEATQAKNYYQLRSSIYFELKNKVYRAVTDTKSNFNPAKLLTYNFDTIVDDAIITVKGEYLEKRNMISNIVIKTLESSKDSK